MEFFLLSIIEAVVSVWTIREVVIYTKNKAWYLLCMVNIIVPFCFAYLILMGNDVTPTPRRFYFQVMCTVGLLIGKVGLRKNRLILEELDKELDKDKE